MAKSGSDRRAKLLVGIIGRGEETAYTEACNECLVGIHFSCLGYGTAQSHYRSYFGIDEVEKSVLISLIPNTSERAVLGALGSKLKLFLPGNGVAFTVPLSGISGIVSKAILSTPEKQEKTKKHKKEKDVMHEVVIAVVNQKFTDAALDAARAAGATGCTVVHSRSIGNEVIEARMGTVLTKETDTLTFLTTSEYKIAIMEAIRDAAGLKTEGSAVIFSLPVDEVVGIGRPSEE